MSLSLSMASFSPKAIPNGADHRFGISGGWRAKSQSGQSLHQEYPPRISLPTYPVDTQRF